MNNDKLDELLKIGAANGCFKEVRNWIIQNVKDYYLSTWVTEEEIIRGTGYDKHLKRRAFIELGSKIAEDNHSKEVTKEHIGTRTKYKMLVIG